MLVYQRVTMLEALKKMISKEKESFFWEGV